jgi:hypothetical protein
MARGRGLKPSGMPRAVFVAGFLAALVLRMAFLLAFRGNYDTGSYAGVADAVRVGGTPYAEGLRYNYAPAWAYTVAGCASLAEALGVSLGAVVGTLLLLVDVATAILLYLLGGRGRAGAAAALLFFANPVSVIATGHYVQFDNLAIAFLLVAILAMVRASREWPASLALAASLLVKHFTFFFPVVFASGKRRRRLSPLSASVPYLIFAASFLPFWKSWPAIVDNVLRYRGGQEDFGVGLLRKIPWIPSWLPALLFLAVVASAIRFGRDRPLPDACLLVFLVMLLFTPGINEYYFVWPIALGALSGGIGYAVYTVVVSLFYLGGSLEGLRAPFTHLPGWGGVWWSLLFWIAWDERRRRVILSNT